MGVMVVLKATTVLTFCAFASNEAHVATRLHGVDAAASLAHHVADLHRLRPHFERSEQEHVSSMSAIMKNMTSHSALEILRQNEKASPELVALAQTAVSHTRLRASISSQASRGPIVAPKGMGAADGAKYMLNSLLEETMKKYDLEILKCRDYYSKQCGMIESARGTIAESGSKVATCRTHILGAEAQIGIGEANIPPSKQAMSDHAKTCKSEVATLHHKLKVLNGDIEAMGRILAMTECGGSYLLQKSATHRNQKSATHIGQSVGLLRCDSGCDTLDQFVRSHSSFVSFDHSPLRSHIDSLKSHVAHQLLQESFSDLAVAAKKRSTNASVTEVRTLVPASPCSDPDKGAPTPTDKRAAKCTLSGTATCTKMQERFMLIQSGLKDEEENMKDEVVSLEGSCEETAVTLSRNVEKAEQTLKQYQTKLAEGTMCENEAAEVGRLTNIEFEEMSQELVKMKETCSSNYQQFETEQCGLKKVRSELYIKMKGLGQKPFFSDCKVSDWLPGECSKDCGGGTQQMTRSIDTQPEGGAKCLPLSQMRRCNEQPCPVDCRMGTWSGWSSCSADCGGGIQERLRDVEQPMKHNGNPCGEVSETKACNVQSCEADCELAEWTKFSTCSKACDGGTRQRVRFIKTPATGQGECASEHSAERMQFKKCATHACPTAKNLTTIKCNSKLDLILVLDGSGSLGKKGWAATKKAAQLIVKAMDPEKTQVSILLYSGPKTYPDVDKCFKDPKVNQEFVCKMQWVQHFTSNIGKALTKLKFLSWPKGATMTSLALMNALAETQNGRQDAKTVVTIITDGKPLSERKTVRAATALRKVARLIWVPVTSFAPLQFIRRLASRPWKENVVLANDFETLESPHFVDHILADMCPEIDGVDDMGPLTMLDDMGPLT